MSRNPASTWSWRTVLVSVLLLFGLQACRSAAQTNGDRARIWELEDENAQLRKWVAVLEERLAAAQRGSDSIAIDEELQAIDAVVLSVDASLKLVVLDKGKADGVKPGYVFTVYRGSTYKGQVRIQDVQETMSSGVITSQKNSIAPGDSATTML